MARLVKKRALIVGVVVRDVGRIECRGEAIQSA